MPIKRAPGSNKPKKTFSILVSVLKEGRVADKENNTERKQWRKLRAKEYSDHCIASSYQCPREKSRITMGYVCMRVNVMHVETKHPCQNSEI